LHDVNSKRCMWLREPCFRYRKQIDSSIFKDGGGERGGGG